MLKAILTANRRGEHKGVYAVCTVNRFAIQAALQRARRDRWPLLIETTAQQVNPEGGYSGMTPAEFAALIRREAAAAGLPADEILLGGDHVGPQAWAALPAPAAMDRARNLVQDLVAAGFVKLHIDATPPCRNDRCEADGSLPATEVVARSTDLIARAEEVARRNGTAPPLYVVGSDVPLPGGFDHPAGDPLISAPAKISQDIAATRRALESRGLAAVWPRVVAVVVRSGADFSSRRVQPFEAALTRSLVRLMDRLPEGLVYEAHSTDFQSPRALQDMVANRFAILKVGPWLTFSFREAVFGLARIERRSLGSRKAVRLSRMAETIETAMVGDPRHWERHYHGSAEELKWLRIHAYSDRIRYYWSYPRPAAAFRRLLDNLCRHPPPCELIAEYLPAVSQAVADGRLTPAPEALIRHQIGTVIALYAAACGAAGGHPEIPAA